MHSFSEIHSFEFLKFYCKRIQDEIVSKGKDYILKVDEEEYVQYLLDKYALEPVTILHDTESIPEPQKSQVRMQNMWQEYYMQDTFTFRVTYNFTGSPDVFRMHPQTRMMTPGNSGNIDVNSSKSTVSFSFTIYCQDTQEFERAKSEAYSDAFANLIYANNDINQMIQGFEGTVRSMFNRAKEAYKKENAFYDAVKIKTNPSTASVFSAPAIKKKPVLQPTVSDKREIASEPTMSKAIYEEILKATYDFGKNMEKKPSLYKGKGEEDLRDQFVLILETKYEGTTATGETFNRSGKTDIILKFAQDGSNLFVAECKMWHGASEMLKAVSQLLSYLTWRDSKVALMLFVQNQSFSDVLSTIESEITKHPQYKKTAGKRGESSFSHIFTLPQDPAKEVLFEVMAFHYDKK